MNNSIIKLNIESSNPVGNLIKVIGVGGGGSNAVNHMFLNGIKDVSFAICNTDLQALDEKNHIPERVQLGITLTQGLGAGNKPSVGRQAALESVDQIEQMLEPSTRMVFVTAGMGGGTGTGAAPIVAKVCSERNMLTVGIVTIPFRSEGRKRQAQALEGIKELEQFVDSLIIINSERIRDIYGNLAMSSALAEADKVLASAAKSIAEIITVHGLVNVDFADVESVMKNSGVANMGSAKASGEDRALKAVKAALNSPLLTHNNISGATSVLVNISSGIEEYECTLNEVDVIFEYIQEKSGHTADVIWGNSYDENFGEELQVNIIVTGFERNMLPNQAPIKNVVSLDDAPANESLEGSIGVGKRATQNTIDFELNNTREVRTSSSSSSSLEYAVQNEEAYAEVDISNMTEEEYLNIPSYRRNKMKEGRQQSMPDEREVSRMSMQRSEYGEPILRKGNSFLHDNVD